MSYVKMLYRHTEAGKGYKPAQLREVLERAIKEFRNNTLFLSVFYHNEGESSSRSSDRAELTSLSLRSSNEDSKPGSTDAGGYSLRQGCYQRGLAFRHLRRAASRRSLAERLGRAQPL